MRHVKDGTASHAEGCFNCDSWICFQWVRALRCGSLVAAVCRTAVRMALVLASCASDISDFSSFSLSSVDIGSSGMHYRRPERCEGDPFVGPVVMWASLYLVG